jgi:hypothetical protein
MTETRDDPPVERPDLGRRATVGSRPDPPMCPLTPGRPAVAHLPTWQMRWQRPDPSDQETDMRETLTAVPSGIVAVRARGKLIRDERRSMPAPPQVGEWLVEPGPPCTRAWRWGRITAVPPDGIHLVVRWYGDSHDTVVLPTPYARIENPAHSPQNAGDAVGLLPAA